MLSAPSASRAADYIVKNCVDESPAWSVDATYEGGGRVEGRHCNQAGSLGQFQLNGRAGHSAEGEYGSWVWQPGAGAGIIAATINARLRNAGGWSAQLYAGRRDGTTKLFGTAGDDDSFRNYGLFETEVGSLGAERLTAQLKCYRAFGCDLDALGGATNRPDNVQFTVRDWRPPVAAAGGPMLEGDYASRWHRGSEPVTIGAIDDGSGVADWAVRVDSGATATVTVGTAGCPGDRGAYAVLMQPCDPGAALTVGIDTHVVADGLHSFEFCARDYGAADQGTLGCSTPFQLHIDNSPPLQPESLQVAGGSDRWHPDNSFDVSWINPPQGAGAPIASAHYRLLDSSGNPVTEEVRSSSSISSLAGLQVPNVPGVYTLEVWLEDEAGNVGPPARTALRFDNQRPGDVTPIAAPGWISRTELPYLQRLSHPGDPLPVSGIEGYAYEVDANQGTDPCGEGDRCTSSQTDLKDGIAGDAVALADLPEGRSVVHAVAVSGSGMESATTGHTALLVDRTDPVTSISGLPSDWQNGSVGLTAHATDALSGMSPSGSESPYTAIRVDGSPPVTSVGPDVSVAVIGEGVHDVSYYARDLAGNVNDGATTRGIQHHAPQVVQVKIDRTSPGVAFVNAQDPNDPELIRASVVDGLSGASGGEIEVHRVGSESPFTPLRTELIDGSLQARWSSDAFPAGEYEFRATAVDRAGNRGRTASRANGTQMVLPNPIKVPTAIRVSFGEKKSRLASPRTVTVPYGRSSHISGRLTAGLGSPLAGQTLEVVERFRAGALVKRRTSRVRTDDKGLFSAIVRPGPSRRVSVLYPGTRTLTRSRGRPLRLTTLTRVSFTASSEQGVVGGRPVVFSGRVFHRAARLPIDGKELEIQYRTSSVPWTTFAPVKADTRGRFKLLYAFKDDESRGVRFQFRALAVRETGWPYAPAASRAQVVVGR